MSIEHGSNSAGIGRFEATQRARNALTGHQERINTRAQELGAGTKNTNNSEQLIKFDTSIIESIRKSNFEDSLWQFEPQFWTAIDKQQHAALINLIKAKKAALEATPTPQTETTAQTKAAPQTVTKAEQIVLTKQLQAEANNIALQAPSEMLLGGALVLATWVIDRLPEKILKRLSLITIATLVLSMAISACSSVKANPEIPGQNDPVPAETSGLPNVTNPAETSTLPNVVSPAESNPPPTVDPAELAEQNMEAKVAASLATNPNNDKTYVRYVEAVEKRPLSQAGVEFLKEIGVNGKKIVDDQYVSIGVNAYGILYAEALDDTVLVFNIKDQSDNYLIATKEEAFRRLSTANPAAIEDKTIDDFLLIADATKGVLASLVDKEGRVVMGVNAQTRQWQAVDSNGELVGDPTAVPTTTLGAKTSAEGLLNSQPEAVTAMVRDFAASKIEFPADLTREQYSAFIKEMNEKYSNKPIWVEAEDKNGNKVTLYHNVTSNKMETLPGSYTDNKEVIDQNYYSTFVEIAEEEGTGNLQYVHPDTGELMTVPNSANVDWTKIIDDKNMYDGYITWPTTEKYEETNGKLLTLSEHQIVGFGEYKTNLVQAILLDKKTTILTREQGAYVDYHCLPMLFVRTNSQGEPLYAIKTFVGPQGMMVQEEENESIRNYLTSLKEKKRLEILEINRVYFVSIHPQQQVLWTNWNHSRIDQLENTASAIQAYQTVVNDSIPKDSNIILTSAVIIKKK